jgi:SAM-dependent methyltransferase
MENSYKLHWENVFSNKQEDEVSWFQPYPKTSVEFVKYFHLPKEANIIDIGGGDSRFVDALIELGYKNIYVLDISLNAIQRAKDRLGKKSGQVHWIISDVLEFVPPVKFDLWHDRAAFHFLTSEENIDRYVGLAENAIKKEGYLVLGTFSEKGPQKCSGLEIRQYSEASMSERFERSFDRIKCINEEHSTPSKSIQHFVFCSFKKK